MKHIVLFLLFFNGFQMRAQINGAWAPVYTSNPYFSAIACPKTNGPAVVYAAGANQGLVVRSLDGGFTWDSIPTPFDALAFAIDFPTPDTGYIVGGEFFAFPPAHPGKYLCRTTDAGNTWQAMFADYNTFPFTKVVFTSGQKGYLLAEDSLYFTNDGGATLQRLDLPGDANHRYLDLVAAGPNALFLSSKRGAGGGVANATRAIYRSLDEGQSWQAVYADTTQGVNNAFYIASLSFPTPNNGFAVTAEDQLLSTADGGQTWNALPTPPDLKSIDLVFTSPDTGYLLCFNMLPNPDKYFIFETTDGGQHWQDYYLDCKYASDIAFANNTHGFAVGSTKILHSRPGQLGVGTFLEQKKLLYPNPTDGLLHWKLPTNGLVPDIWEVYDLSGKRVGTGMAYFGFANVELLPSGVYDFVLKCDGEVVLNERFIK